jgi:hypothetical protein
MKKIFLPMCLLFVVSISSCGGGDKGAGASEEGGFDYNAVLDKMVEDGKLNKEAREAIKEAISKKKSESEENEETNEPLDPTKAKKVNSLKLLTEIYADRSINLSKYLGQQIIVTDLLLSNVLIKDRGEGFVKCASAFPYNPATREIAVSYGEYDDYPSFTYNYTDLNIVNEIGGNKASIDIEFKNPDEMKKIGALEWENLLGNNFDYKVDIVCVLKKENITYSEGTDEWDDMKAKRIKITFENAEIVTKKGKK